MLNEILRFATIRPPKRTSIQDESNFVYAYKDNKPSTDFYREISDLVQENATRESLNSSASNFLFNNYIRELKSTGFNFDELNKWINVNLDSMTIENINSASIEIFKLDIKSLVSSEKYKLSRDLIADNILALTIETKNKYPLKEVQILNLKFYS